MGLAKLHGGKTDRKSEAGKITTAGTPIPQTMTERKPRAKPTRKVSRCPSLPGDTDAGRVPKRAKPTDSFDFSKGTARIVIGNWKTGDVGVHVTGRAGRLKVRLTIKQARELLEGLAVTLPYAMRARQRTRKSNEAASN